MRILRVRTGFQADHSSSSYLFYAIDGKVSPEGQRIAHRFSSHAEVDRWTASFQKYGENELSGSAYEALLAEHYDVMASESYDSWTLMIAVPKSKQLEELLRPYHDFDGGGYRRIEVHDYGKRLCIEVQCEFDEDALWAYDLDDLVKMLAKLRDEIKAGDVSFLQGVAHFYQDEEDDEEEDEDAPPENWTKAELQQECDRRGIRYAKSWTKDQLREALSPAPIRFAKPAKLSPTARKIINHLDQR